MNGYLEREPAPGGYGLPDARGHFELFGGKFVPETVMPALEELEREFRSACRDPEFRATLRHYLATYSGRPTALTYAERLTKHLGGPKIYLKREDLNHTGAHKINNTLGQGLLTRRMGKKRIIAETGAGQHGVASATAAAMFGLECKVFMGAEDVERQALNVYRMKLLGAEVVPVQSGTRTLKDATNEAIRHWVTHVRDTHYIIGSVVGPAPYPMIVREFQSVIGLETIEQIRTVEGRLPDAVVACVGGGSNAMGMFHPFIDHAEVALVCVEAAGHGLTTDQHGASLAKGEPGVLHGSLSMVVQTETGQIQPAHSISAGLDYPGVGPELAYLGRTGRVRLGSATDAEALEGFQLLARTEGIIPALESAHAIAHLAQIAGEFPNDALVVVCLSGRGDKDVVQVSKVLTL